MAAGNLATSHRAPLGLDKSVENTLIVGCRIEIGIVPSTIWCGPTALINYPSVASKIKLTSSDVEDKPLGSGCGFILFQGLLEDNSFAREIVTLDGQNEVETEFEYRRILKCRRLSPNVNAGDIYMFTGASVAGIPTDLLQIYDFMEVGKGQTQSARTTIPKNFTGLVLNFIAGAPGADVALDVLIREQGLSFRSAWPMSFRNQMGEADLQGLPAIASGADVEVRMRTELPPTALATTCMEIHFVRFVQDSIINGADAENTKGFADNFCLIPDL